MNELDLIFTPVERSLDITAKQLEAIARNVANANTPGYQRVTVSFDGLLKAAMETDADKKLGEYAKVKPEIVVDQNAAQGPNGNSVNVDQELAFLNRVRIRHQLAARMTNGKLSNMRMAISGR